MKRSVGPNSSNDACHIIGTRRQESKSQALEEGGSDSNSVGPSVVEDSELQNHVLADRRFQVRHLQPAAEVTEVPESSVRPFLTLGLSCGSRGPTDVAGVAWIHLLIIW